MSRLEDMKSLEDVTRKWAKEFGYFLTIQEYSELHTAIRLWLKEICEGKMKYRESMADYNDTEDGSYITACIDIMESI